MNEPQRPEPSAQGDFTKTPFAHILLYLFGKKLTGTLEVIEGEAAAQIFFRDGTPAKVRLSSGGPNLGEVLLAHKLVSNEQLSAAKQAMKEGGGLLGQHLLKAKALGPAELVRGVREQMLAKLVDVFGLLRGEYAFYEKVNLLHGFGPDEVFPIDPFPLLAAGLRAHGDRLRLEPVLQAAAGGWIALEDPLPLKRFRFDDPEKELCITLLDGPVSYDELMGGQRHERSLVRRVLYLLLVTKQLQVVGTAPEQAPGRRTSPGVLDSVAPPTRRLSIDPEAALLGDQLQKKAAQLASQNYFEMLDLPVGAEIDEVRKAFFKLAKSYHPDRAVGPLGELKETFQYVFSNLSEAHATLIDQDAREEYLAALAEAGERTAQGAEDEEEAQVRDLLEAESAFQRALIYARKEQWAETMELIDRARMLNPDEGEYRGLWAWVEWRRRKIDEDCSDLIEVLRGALVTNPNSERMHLHLAQMAKRAGKLGEALEHFQKVLQINPRNIDAAREVRVMQMRGQSGAKDGASGKGKSGLFSRFRK